MCLKPSVGAIRKSDESTELLVPSVQLAPRGIRGVCIVVLMAVVDTASVIDVQDTFANAIDVVDTCEGEQGDLDRIARSEASKSQTLCSEASQQQPSVASAGGSGDEPPHDDTGDEPPRDGLQAVAAKTKTPLPPLWKLTKFTVKGLKDLLKERRLSMTGRKSDLMERLEVVCYSQAERDEHANRAAGVYARNAQAHSEAEAKAQAELTQSTQSTQPNEPTPSPSPGAQDEPSQKRAKTSIEASEPASPSVLLGGSTPSTRHHDALWELLHAYEGASQSPVPDTLSAMETQPAEKEFVEAMLLKAASSALVCETPEVSQASAARYDSPFEETQPMEDSSLYDSPCMCCGSYKRCLREMTSCCVRALHHGEVVNL